LDLSQGNLSGAQAASEAQQQAYEMAVASTLTPGTNSAVLEGAKWNSQVITWSIADYPGTESAEFSSYMSSAYESVIQSAFNTWSAASGLTFKEVSDSEQSDIRIGWGDLDTVYTGVVGYTSYQSEDGRFTPDTIIRLEDPSEDALVTGADGQQTYSGTEAEFSQVLLHEIGHALGLADDADPNSIMYYAAGTNNTTLDSADLTGIQALYGSGQNVGLISGNVSTSVDQLIQAMATFNAGSGAAVSSLSSQNSALTTNNSLAASPSIHH
jgi:predicted Zn-dependent protease